MTISIYRTEFYNPSLFNRTYPKILLNARKEIQEFMAPLPYRVTHEQLNGSGTELTSFYFRYGANIYVFSYQQDGVKKHTFIDAVDYRYRDEILSILPENGIDPAAIERIILTHRHPDHTGLAHLLARESGARILVHPNFKDFIENPSSESGRGWMGNFNQAKLAECDIEYLPISEGANLPEIGGLRFPGLAEPIDIGGAGKILILAPPESEITHTQDQLIVVYSPGAEFLTGEGPYNGCRPMDRILFSGDLWLMTGPLFDRGRRGLQFFFRYHLFQMKRLITGQGMSRWAVMDQDLSAKEALKGHFSLIRVKPGHGDEFIGSRIIPRSLPADRDLLKELGYPLNAGSSVLKSARTAPLVDALTEKAYASFVREVISWQEYGYEIDEMSEFLVRLFKEQSGGKGPVALDRAQRRVRMKATLARLRDAGGGPEELGWLAELTLPKLEALG